MFKRLSLALDTMIDTMHPLHPQRRFLHPDAPFLLFGECLPLTDLGGHNNGVYGSQYTKVMSGRLKAVGDSEGLYSFWEMTVGKDVESLEMEGDSAAYAGNEIKIDDKLFLLEPEDGCLSSNHRRIPAKDVSTALHAVIASDSFILGDGEITQVDVAYIRCCAAHIKVPYPIGEAI